MQIVHENPLPWPCDNKYPAAICTPPKPRSRSGGQEREWHTFIANAYITQLIMTLISNEPVCLWWYDPFSFGCNSQSFLIWQEHFLRASSCSMIKFAIAYYIVYFCTHHLRFSGLTARYRYSYHGTGSGNTGTLSTASTVVAVVNCVVC